MKSGGSNTAWADPPALRDYVETWKAAFANTGWTPWLILGLALFLRFFLLGIKPAHFDEGINGWFVDQMVRNGFYRYDPTNYHGPLHFYVLLLSQALFGRNIWALRLPVVLVSIAAVWLTMKFEAFVGKTVSRMAALAMAVSPAFVFYGRYSIHEAWMLLFSMMFVLGLLGLWKFGTRGYLWCAGMGATGMILSKETYVIHIGCAVIAGGVLPVFNLLPTLSAKRRRYLMWGLLAAVFVCWFLPWVKQSDSSVSGFSVPSAVPHGRYLWIGFVACGIGLVWSLLRGNARLLSALVATLTLGALAWGAICFGDTNNYHILPGGYVTALLGAGLLFTVLIPPPNFAMDMPAAKRQWDYLDLAIVIATGIALIVFFYSGTFFHWSGVKGIFKAYAAWFQTGEQGHGHEKLWYYWLTLMAPTFHFSRADCLGYELPALAGLVLCLFCLYFKNLSLRYLAIYSVGVLMVYSYVHYKTPWCIISIIWPFLFLFAAAFLIVPAAYKAVVYGAGTVLLGISLMSTVWLNYFDCTTDTEPYVYVQTYNDIFKLTRPVLTLAHHDPVFYQMTGYIIRASPYPLPWILDDFPRVGYYEHNNFPADTDADFLLVQQDKIKEVEAKLHHSYYTEPLTLRAYQDPSKLYLSAKIFKGFFPGRAPDFVGPAQKASHSQ
jgi:4-amino-4-deoxy-L-arabinose transferase-like glycosyltransferase